MEFTQNSDLDPSLSIEYSYYHLSGSTTYIPDLFSSASSKNLRTVPH
jgi:hypothetical protein